MTFQSVSSDEITALRENANPDYSSPHERTTTVDRWRMNQPTGPTPPSIQAYLLCGVSCTIAALTLLIIALCFLSSAAQGAEPREDRPALYLFGFVGCTYCDILEKEFTSEIGQLKRFTRDYRLVKVDIDDKGAQATAIRQDYLGAIPTQLAPVDLAGPGVRERRIAGQQLTSVPVLWVEGRSDYWLGFHRSELDRLAGYLDRVKPISPLTPPVRSLPVDVSTAGESPVPTPVADEPQRYERLEPIPDPAFSISLGATGETGIMTSPGTATPINSESSQIAPPQEDFTGVTIVVLVANLGEGRESLRAELARRANSALQGLVRKHLGERVDAYLIAEVADKETYERLVATVGVRPGVGTSQKVAALVLIPERLDGLRGWIIGKLEQSLADHFLPDLKRAGIMPIVQRIHGDTFDAVLEALVIAEGGSVPTNQPLIFLAAAYLSERSKVGTWLARRLGWVV